MLGQLRDATHTLLEAGHDVQAPAPKADALLQTPARGEKVDEAALEIALAQTERLVEWLTTSASRRGAQGR